MSELQSNPKGNNTSYNHFKNYFIRSIRSWPHS